MGGYDPFRSRPQPPSLTERYRAGEISQDDLFQGLLGGGSYGGMGGGYGGGMGGISSIYGSGGMGQYGGYGGYQPNYDLVSQFYGGPGMAMAQQRQPANPYRSPYGTPIGRGGGSGRRFGNAYQPGIELYKDGGELEKDYGYAGGGIINLAEENNPSLFWATGGKQYEDKDLDITKPIRTISVQSNKDDQTILDRIAVNTDETLFKAHRDKDDEKFKYIKTGDATTTVPLDITHTEHVAAHLQNIFETYTLGKALDLVEKFQKARGKHWSQRDKKQEGGIANMAEGSAYPRLNGLTMGPGGETGDEIPAMLSDGEFVMNARGMRGGGAMSLLEKGAPMSMIQDPAQQRLEGARLMYAQQAMGEALADALRNG